MSAQRASLPGNRLHFSHGPIDLVIGAEGDAAAVTAAHRLAWQRFTSILAELVAELPALRMPVGADCILEGPVARSMWQACAPYRANYITPMAAVAGAVAQEIVAAYRRPGIARAWVNNGGDIALHLAPDASVRVGLVADIANVRHQARPASPGYAQPGLDGNFTVSHASPVRGIATSGWRGRSFSLGIADSVTVLARTAAEADAAATVIANAVNVDDARIVRQPACELKDDTDLGRLPVTVEVPPLEPTLVHTALAVGLARAQALRARGLIDSAALVCQGYLFTTAQDAHTSGVVRTLPAAPQGGRMVRELLDLQASRTIA